MKRLLVILLLTACATTPSSQPAAPEWDVVPAGLVEAFCSRLRMDAIATGGGLAIVRTTQPIASAQAYSGLGRSVGNKARTAPQPGRTMPIDLGAGSCGWTPIDSMNAQRDRDVMVVELSSPVPNPFVPGAAGIFARVSLGGEHASWYWIGLVPRGGGWTVGSITTIDAR